MKWMLLILFALPNLAIGQAGQTEERNKVQTAWCEFAGLVALIPLEDSANPKTKVLLGTTMIEYKKIHWFDSLIIDGRVIFHRMPTFMADFSEPAQELFFATSDSLFLISLDHPFSALTPDIHIQRYPISRIAHGATTPEDYAFTTSFTDSGSLITRFYKEILVPVQELHIPDSILFLTGLPDWSSSFETIHHQDSNFLTLRWTSNLFPVDTLYITDTLGEVIGLDNFAYPGDPFRILLAKDSLYSLIVPNSGGNKIDTIIHSVHSIGAKPRVGQSYYYYVNSVHNDTTYLKTIADINSPEKTYLLPGHARLIQMILTYNGFEEYSFLWVDSTTNNIYAYFDEYGALDTIGKMRDSAVAIGAIHFCWEGIEVGDPDIAPTIYPNPAKDAVYFRPAALRHPQQYHIEIFNGQGQLLNASVKPGDETVELSLKGIPYGLLLIRITGGELSETFKVLHQ